MLLGALPPVANAKDEGYILYSEDGVEMKKIKREFFTADVEKMGCDYWKEGSGDDKQNLSGAFDSYNASDYNGIDAIVGGSQWSGHASNVPKNYQIYNASKAKKYCHYGDFWLCFKLREGETENGGSYFVSGNRAVVDPSYIADPSQVNNYIDSVSSVDNYPIAIYNYVAYGINRVRFITKTSSKMSYEGEANFIPTYGPYSHFYKEINSSKKNVIATNNRNYGYGLRGIKQQGTIFSATVNYKGDVSPIGSHLTYKETPNITHTDTYTYKYLMDEETKRYVDETYYTDTDLDASEIPLIDNIISWGNLYNLQYNNPNNVEHCLWKVGVGDTILIPPTQIEPSFYRILPIANNRWADGYDGGTDAWYFPSLNAPRGVLRSIPVVGVEAYNTPIYDGYHTDYYDHGKSYYYYMPVEDYYSYTGYTFYWQSRTMFPMRNSIPSINMISGRTPHYYINDLGSNFINNNYIAMSRKGIRISLCKKIYYEETDKLCDHQRCMNMMIGAKNVMDVNDVSEIEYDFSSGFYNTAYNYGKEGGTTYSGGSWEDGLKGNLYFVINKYGDGTLDIGTAKVNPNLIDTSYSPPANCDYFVNIGVGYMFKNRFVASDDLYFDDKTLNSVYSINPETNTPIYTISLKTLWQLNIKTGGDTLYSLATKFAQSDSHTRPVLNTVLNLTSSNTKNYGFGSEFTVDTTNNKVTKNSEGVEATTMRIAGVKDIRTQSIVMRDSTGCYQSIRLTDGDAGTSVYARHGNTSAKFRPEDIYYCTIGVDKGMPITKPDGISRLFRSYKQVAISDIAGWTAPYNNPTNGSLYLVGTIDSDGYFSVVSNMYNLNPRRYGYITETLPTSEDGYYYIYLGEYRRTTQYANDTYLDFVENHPIYYYKNGKIREYYYTNIPNYPKGFQVVNSSDGTTEDVMTADGKVYLQFDSHFTTSFNNSTGQLDIDIDKSTLPTMQPDYYIHNNSSALTNLDPSWNYLTEIQDLKFNDSSITYYIDVTVTFKTTDNSVMTDGTFIAWMSYSDSGNVMSGRPGDGQPVGYFKHSRTYAVNESEVAIRMKGYINDSMGRGAQYPKIIVRHTCSTNIDVGYSINGYRVK